MPHGQCLSLGGKQLIKWQSSDLEVIVEDQHLKREVDDSVCELEISEVMEGGKAEKQFVRWQSSDFEEEESSSSSEDDDKGMRQLYMQKMRQAEALKESSTDLSMCDQNLKAPEKGPSSLSIKLVVENRNADQLAMKDLSTGPLNKSVEEEVPVKDQICKWWTSGKRPAQVEEAGCKKLFGAGPVDDSDQLATVRQVDGEWYSKKLKQFGTEEQPRDRLVREW